MAEGMPVAGETPKVEIPKKVCEKCRNSFLLDHFDHAIEGQECVCKRCLRVMGYPV